jgi:hypothetical protein
MAGPADHPFQGPGMALRTLEDYFVIRTHEELFKNMPTFEASEFKNRHSFFSSIQGFKRFHNKCYG